MAFGQKPPGNGQHQGHERGQNDEDPLPAEVDGHKNTNAGGQQRRDTQNQNQERDDFGGFVHMKEVPHHGHGSDGGGASAQRLDEAQGDQPFHGARTQAEQGGGNEQG